jgi:hypothetical protein
MGQLVGQPEGSFEMGLGTAPAPVPCRYPAEIAEWLRCMWGIPLPEEPAAAGRRPS